MLTQTLPLCRPRVLVALEGKAPPSTRGLYPGDGGDGGASPSNISLMDVSCFQILIDRCKICIQYCGMLLYLHNGDHLPVRKHPAHCQPIEVGNRSVILFITVCSHRKKQIFATTDAFRTLILAWTQADAWAIGRFVVMPEHIHIFCAPADSRFSVRSWGEILEVSGFSRLAFRCRQTPLANGSLGHPNPSRESV